MTRWLVLFSVLALPPGCSSSTTQTTDTGSGGGADTGSGGTDTGTGGIDGGTGGTDTGVDVDAFTPGSDTGIDAAATIDTGHDAAPRADAGMCVDPPPDPTRPTAGTCSACRPPGPGGGTGTCVTDADCPDTATGTNGRCVFGRIGAFCSYDECFDDQDCQPTEACLCDAGQGGGNACVSASCHVDADCTGGFACSPTFGSCGHYSGFVAYRCHTAADTCTVDADCSAGYCAYDELTAHWACSTSECAG